MSFCRDLVGLVNRCYAVYSFLSSSNLINPQQKPWRKLTKTNMPQKFSFEGKQVWKIGVNFSNKKRTVDEWIIEK